jgi:uncharacterized protein YdaU (DUF1376 family)
MNQKKDARAIFLPALLWLAENPQSEDRIFSRQALRCSAKWQWVDRSLQSSVISHQFAVLDSIGVIPAQAVNPGIYLLLLILVWESRFVC